MAMSVASCCEDQEAVLNTSDKLKAFHTFSRDVTGVLPKWQEERTLGQQISQLRNQIQDHGGQWSNEKLITGSYSGVLRIYVPHAQEDIGKDSYSGGPQTDCLLLEAQLDEPILQIECGKLVSSSEQLHLAVLHPRRLIVYGVSDSSADGASTVDHGRQWRLILAYEHRLQRSAFCFVVGPFGKVRGRDFMAVMSLDGTVSLFEQESFAFSRYLPGALLPGPLSYAARTDCFLTVSSSGQLEAFKYQALAVATSGDSNDNSFVGGPETFQQKGKQVQADWTYDLGECGRSVAVITPKNNCPPLIYILGERNLFCFKDNGALKFMKKLDSPPSCFHVYSHGQDGNVLLLLATHSGMLLVYQDLHLRWASRLPAVPIQICRVNLRGLRGGLAMLSDNGFLCCSYLGTNPSIYTPPPLESREINYEETDREMTELYRIINASQKSGAHFVRPAESSLQLTATANCSAAGDAILRVQLQAPVPLEQVHLGCCFGMAWHVAQPSHFFPSFGGEQLWSTTVSCREGCVPWTLRGSVTVTYHRPGGGPPCIALIPVDLPLNVALCTCAPQKEADIKATLTTSKAAVRLDDLFPEFVDPSHSGSSQAMGLKYMSGGGAPVTLLVAKTSQRYRIQSDSFESIAFVCSELISRLTKWFSRSSTMRNDDWLTLGYSGIIPLKEMIQAAEQHLRSRKQLEAREKLLGQLAAQLRAIEKRLLVKLKDKTMATAFSLDLLLENTYRQLLETADEVEERRNVTKQLLCKVMASADLFCTLLQLATCLGPSETALLRQILCPPLDNENTMGWEEVVVAGLTGLLHTVFPGDAGHDGGHELPKQWDDLNMPCDVTVLHKRLAAIVDRLERRSAVSVREEDENEERNAENIVTEVKEEENDSGVKPLGISFGDVHRRRQDKSKVKQIHAVKNLEETEKRPERDTDNMEILSKEDLSSLPLLTTSLPVVHTVAYDSPVPTFEEF